MEENSRPDNRSEKYLYIPCEEDYIKIHNKFKKKPKNRCVMCFYVLVLWICAAPYIIIKLPDESLHTPIYIAGCVLSWIITYIIISLAHGSRIKDISQNPLWMEKKYISFDGYHFLIESDHMIQMFPIKNNVKVLLDESGIYLLGPDEIRYYPQRTFGSAREMGEFYDRLKWDEVYQKKYNPNPVKD